jgi:hypothetical protein
MPSRRQEEAAEGEKEDATPDLLLKRSDTTLQHMFEDR